MIAVIFEVTPTDEGKDEYLEIAGELKTLLGDMEGFISIERFVSLSDENRLLSLSFWKDQQTVRAWREQVFHREAQAKGRHKLFSNYRIRVAEVIRDYGMDDRAQAPRDKLISTGT